MVKFRIGEDGVLKGGEHLSVDRLSAQLIGTIGDRVSDGTFTIHTTISGINPEPVAFASNTVLYKNEGNKWVAYRATKANFNLDPAGTTYQFLKTDAKGDTYDVIIKN
jgi:hypothetical protein